MHLTLNCDGASRGNPGQAATGYVVKDESGQVLAVGGSYLGTATNNFAEYNAVIEGLGRVQSEFESEGIDSLDVYLDSKLVVEQLNGHYKVKNEILRLFFYQIGDLIKAIGDVKFHHIPRNLNKQADAQANKVLDTHKKHDG